MQKKEQQQHHQREESKKKDLQVRFSGLPSNGRSLSKDRKPEHTLIADRFQILETLLGAGSFGYTYKGLDLKKN